MGLVLNVVPGPAAGLVLNLAPGLVLGLLDVEPGLAPGLVDLLTILILSYMFIALRL